MKKVKSSHASFVTGILFVGEYQNTYSLPGVGRSTVDSITLGLYHPTVLRAQPKSSTSGYLSFPLHSFYSHNIFVGFCFLSLVSEISVIDFQHSLWRADRCYFNLWLGLNSSWACPEEGCLYCLAYFCWGTLLE